MLPCGTAGAWLFKTDGILLGVGATDDWFADKPRCPGVVGTCAAADVAASFDVAESFDDVVVLSRGFGFLFNGGDCD